MVFGLLRKVHACTSSPAFCKAGLSEQCTHSPLFLLLVLLKDYRDGQNRMGSRGLLAKLLARACGSFSTRVDDVDAVSAAAVLGKGHAAADISSSRCIAADVLLKEESAAAIHASSAGGSPDSSSTSSCIPVAYDPVSSNTAGSQSQTHTRCTDTASTSYPTSYGDGWDALGACMTTASEMEACVDAVLEGSIKSAQHMFCRYDMDLDFRLRPQDYYDLMLELNLALPYAEYQRFVDNTFAVADSDRDGALTVDDFIPLYKRIAAVRRAFRRQDHHCNGLIDRYDFYQVLRELQLDGGRFGLQALADAAFGEADAAGRGIVNFGQVLVWYSTYLASSSRASTPQPRQRQQL